MLDRITVSTRDGFGKSCSGSLTIDSETGVRIPGMQMSDLEKLTEAQFLDLLRKNKFTNNFRVFAEHMHQRMCENFNAALSDVKDERGVYKSKVMLIYEAQV